jgi:hypothetical protein
VLVLGQVLVLQVLELVLVLLLVLVLGLGRGLLRSSLTHNTLVRQSRATPEPQNKYILNGTGTTSEGKKRYLPGMISERYGAVKNTCPWLFPQETRFLSMSPSFQQAKNTTSKEGARNMQTGTTIQSLNQGQCNIWLVKYREFRV